MSITEVGWGAWSSGVTTGLPNASFPAGTILAGDIAVYQLNVHKAAAQTESVGNVGDVNAAGWKLEAVLTGNTQATNVDTGPCLIAFFTKVMAGGEQGTATPGEIVVSGNTTGTSGTSSAGRIGVLHRSAGSGWLVAATTGTDNSTGTAWSITFGSIALDTGDYIAYGNCLPTDTNPTTYGSETFTATGATISAASNESALSIAAGLDCGGKSASRTVTAGPSTAAPVWAATLTGTTTNASGPAGMVRFRENLGVDLTPATTTFSAVAVSPVPGQVTVALTAATVTMSGAATNPVPQPVTVSLTAAVMTMTAVTTNPVPQAVTVALTTGNMTFTAPPTTPQSAVNLTAAVVTLTGVAVNAIPGQVTTNLTSAVLTLSGVTVNPVPQPVTVNLTPGVITISAVQMGVGGQIPLTAAVTMFSGVAVNAVPGVVTTPLTPASIVVSAVAVTGVPGVVTVVLTPSSMTLTAVVLSPVPQPVVVVLVSATIMLSAPLVTFIHSAVNLVPAVMTLMAVALFHPLPDAIAYIDVPVVVATMDNVPLVQVSLDPLMVEAHLHD